MIGADHTVKLLRSSTIKIINNKTMATYKQIQNDVKINNNKSVKTCWIAHVKELNGLNPRRAFNRKSNKRVYECPDDKRLIIEESMMRFGMLKK
ncbi:hypothetical protein C8D91_2652 [Marinicella litoralis]|uniref:Uncharacterized protein n=1 Tax=Marinicella litoralis TaxID=644220 RepID=A0A4R6XC10_9GAMM|nr:hypothetical protein C8D91_2652 [Marinicella litoralis]